MPKIVDHAQRREEIVQALWKVIHDLGIEGVTYQAVAKAGGVSVGRIQHYFTSKEELVLAGCRAMVSRATTAFHARVSSMSPAEALVDLLCEPIPRTESFRRGAAVWYAYLARAVVDREIGDIVREASRGTVDEAAGLLRAAGAPTGSATRLVALSNGFTQRVLIGITTPDEAMAALADEVERTLRSERPGQESSSTQSKVR